MDGIGAGFAKALTTLIFAGFLVGAVLIGIIWGGISIFSSNELETKELIQPIRIEIHKEGTKVDTTYIYQLPLGVEKDGTKVRTHTIKRFGE